MAKGGDVGTVEECRPYSKSKTWKLLSEGEAVLSEPEIQESQS
jgi:ribosomal protein S17